MTEGRLRTERRLIVYAFITPQLLTYYKVGEEVLFLYGVIYFPSSSSSLFHVM